MNFLEYLSFDKIQSGCILRDSLYLYNTKQDSKIDYQKYANNIVVGWDFKRDTTGKLIKVTNDSKRPWKNLNVLRGEGFAQGIFVEYGITIDDEAAGVRNGGFGSTTKNE